MKAAIPAGREPVDAHSVKIIAWHAAALQALADSGQRSPAWASDQLAEVVRIETRCANPDAERRAKVRHSLDAQRQRARMGGC